MSDIAYVSIGSNLGDSPGYVREALMRLGQIATPITNSDLYRSRPWGKTNQPDFYNAVAVLDMGKRRDPLRLLYSMTAIEAEYDRAHTELWGPRTLDLDLLLYGDLIDSDPLCTLPHPRLRDRAFVLAPLAEVAPDLKLPPDDATPKQLLERLPLEEWAGIRRIAGTGHLPPPRAFDYDAGAGEQYGELRPVSDFDRRIFDEVAATIGLKEGMRILDVGCGTGRFTRLLAQAGANATGLDKSATMLASARKHTNGAAAQFVTGDAVESLPDGPWDALTVFYAVHHFADVERFLLNAKRKLVPGGTLAFASFPHRHYAQTPWADFFPSFPAIDMARTPSAPGLRRALRHAGFADIEERDVHGEVTQDYQTVERLVRAKFLSTFHLIGDAEFERGLKTMHDAWHTLPSITRAVESVVIAGRRP